MAANPTSSWLLIEEAFAAGDDRFLDALRAFHVPGRLALFADRWKKDPRPWARQQILKYLQLPLNVSAHETVVKRLFKHAEQQGDDELMAAFALVFDRLVRRRRRKKFHYDRQTRQGWQEEFLRTPYNQIPAPSGRIKEPVRPTWNSFEAEGGARRLFSYHTRYYLRRRAWRYFRRMGYSRPNDYPRAVAGLLRQYRDEDLARGENILDSWSLLHACFRGSDVLEFGETHVKVKPGRGLRELAPSPQFPKLWKTQQAGKVLLDLVVEAGARLVRVWAIQLLRAEHAESLSGIAFKDLRRLLDHADPEVQLLGAELLEKARGLETLPLDIWLELLETRNLTALGTICQLMARHVGADRLDLAGCVRLACAEPTPVARLGLDYLRQKRPRGRADLDAITHLAAARCATVGREIAEWAMGHLAGAEAYDLERVSPFFDALLKEIREGAWTSMTLGSRAWDDPGLWSRLIETPYDDVRLRLIHALEQRKNAPGVGGQQLSTVWAGVLLGIHRGGRHKLIALRQISDAVRNDPDSAGRLLSVLAVAIRSVRPPEARAGLAAIVSAIEARPDLANLVATHLPELQLHSEEAA